MINHIRLVRGRAGDTVTDPNIMSEILQNANATRVKYIVKMHFDFHEYNNKKRQTNVK